MLERVEVAAAGKAIALELATTTNPPLSIGSGGPPAGAKPAYSNTQLSQS